MKKSVMFLALILLLASTSFAQLRMTMSTDKEVYAYGDTIYISCSIKNMGDTTISIISGSYGSCQAELYFNNFYSGSQEQCLATTEKLQFDSGTEKAYYWTIDPKRYGLPNRNGEQTIIGKFFQVLPDTITITAPKFYGGQLSVSFPDSLNYEASLIKDSLNVDVLSSDSFNGSTHEVWQIYGYSIDSLMTIWNDSTNGQFDYAEFNRWTQYDSIKTSPSNDFAQFYPLHIGDKWFYEVKQYEANNNPTISYLLKEVTGDTIMPNGIKYFIVKNGNQTQYERFDSTKGEVKYFMSNCNPNDGSKYSLSYNEDSIKVWQSCDGFTYNISYQPPSTIEQDTTFVHLEDDGVANVDIDFKKYVGITHKIIQEVGKVEYSLLGYKINGRQHGLLTSIKESKSLSVKFSLSQNYPNPFNPSTTISYTIPTLETLHATSPQLTTVRLTIFDVLGREVATLVNKKQNPGNYEVQFDTGNLSSGVYYYRLKAGGFIKTRKMVLLK